MHDRIGPQALFLTAPDTLPGIKEPGSIGAGVVLYPVAAFRAMISRPEQDGKDRLRAILCVGHPSFVIDPMQTCDECYDRIGYHDFEQKRDALFARKK